MVLDATRTFNVASGSLLVNGVLSGAGGVTLDNVSGTGLSQNGGIGSPPLASSVLGPRKHDSKILRLGR